MNKNTQSAQLRADLEKSIRAYVDAFSKKHDIEFSYAIHDDLLSEVYAFGRIHVTLSEIIFDIDKAVDECAIYSWRDFVTSPACSEFISFDKYCIENDLCGEYRRAKLRRN